MIFVWIKIIWIFLKIAVLILQDVHLDVPGHVLLLLLIRQIVLILLFYTLDFLSFSGINVWQVVWQNLVLPI
tara:strand:- start:379 stop:594 length:216 start_codon:yes stop_codon:yes gene_type:complete